MSLTSAEFANCMLSVNHAFLFVTHVCILLLLSWILYVCILFTTLWANSADDKLMIFFIIFPENRHWSIFHADYILGRWSSYFLGKTRKNMSLTSAEFAHCMVSVNQVYLFVTHVCIFSWVVFYMFVFCIPLYVQIQQMTSFFVFFLLLIFFQKMDIDILCRLFPGEMICIKWQHLFSGETRKVFQNLLNFFSQGAEC